MDCIEQYLPHRVARQFGLDQDVPGDVLRANQDWAVAWQTYQLEGKNVTFFIPESEPGITARYAQWWRQPLPSSHLHAGAPTIPVEWKTSKRKVKKTAAAMEAEAEKERKMKKARVSPCDKKRKLEELYDPKLSGWLAAGRIGISDAAGGSCKKGSLPKYDMGSDEALLPNVGTTNDDAVLLVPRMQTASPALVMPKKDDNMNLAIGDRGKIIVDESPDIPNNEPEGGVTAVLEEEKLNIPVDSSLAITDKSEGATVVMELEKEASGVSDRPEEVTAPVLEGKEEKVAIEEAVCVTGMTPEEVSGVSDTPEEVTAPVIEEKEEKVDIEGAIFVTGMTPAETSGVSDRPEGVTAPVIEEKEQVGIEGAICVMRMTPAEASGVSDRPEEVTAPVIEEKEENVAIEGAICIMGMTPAEASGVSDRPEEVTAPVIDEREEKVSIEGTICVTGMTPAEKSIATVMEADEENAVSEEVGRAARESIEAVEHSQQEVDAGVMNDSHDLVALPEVALSIEHTSTGGGCSNVSCIMEDSNVAGMGTNDGETTCRDFVAEDQREFPCVEEIEGENIRMVVNDSKEHPQEAPQTEIVVCVEDIVLMGTDDDSEQKELPPTVEEVVTSHSMDAALLGVGVPEAENVEVATDLNLAKKDAEDMPMEVAEGEEAEQEQINTLDKGGAEEEHKEISEVDHTDMVDPKMHSHFNTETPEKAAQLECAEIDCAMGLTGRDTDGKIGDVPEVGHTEVEEVRGLIVNASDEKLAEVSQVEHAEVKDVNKKFEEVPALEHTGSKETHGPIEEEDIGGELKEVHDVNAEMEVANEHERPQGILQVDLLTRDEVRWLAKEDVEENTTEIPQLECEKLRDEGPKEEDTNEKLCAGGKDLPEKDFDDSKLVYKAKQAEGGGCKVLLEKDDESISDAPGVEQAAEGQSKALPEKGIHDHVEEITLMEQVDGRSEKLKMIGTEEIPEEITQAHEKEFDSDMMKDSNYSTNVEVPCSSAIVQLNGGTMEKQCIQNVELINQREPPSDATAMKVKEEVALKQKEDHKIVCENRNTTIMEGSHMLDRELKPGLATLEVDDTHAAGGIQNQEILDLDKEMTLKQKQDHIIICENRETIVPEGSYMLDSGVKSDLVTLEDDGTIAAGGIENQEILDSDKQQGVNERRDLGTTIENNRMNMSEDADILVSTEYQIDPNGTEVSEVESTKRIQNQELLGNKELLALEERQHLGTTTENNKMNMPEDADILVCDKYQIDSTGTEVIEVESIKRIQNQELWDNKELLAREERQHLGTTMKNNKVDMSDGADILVCGEYQIDSIGAEVIEVESTKVIHNQELLDNKKDQVMEKRMECEVTDESGLSLEESNKLGGGGVDTCAVAVNVSNSMQIKEAWGMEEMQTREDKEHHGVEHANERRILEDTSMIDSGELKSDATVVDVDMAASREGTLNQCALSMEKEVALQEKQDQEMADKGTDRDVADIGSLECGGMKPDGAVKMFHDILHATQAVNIAGPTISSENKLREAPFEDNITEVLGSESNQTARMPEGTLPPEPDNLVEVKQENLVKETERSIFRENDEVSCKDQTSAEVMTAPSYMDDQGEDDNGWAEESTKNYDKLDSYSRNTACHHPMKFGKSSNEEVKRTQNNRLMYLKDIKESLGRIRAEPSNRVQTTSVGYSSRYAVQESISSCKEIKMPLRDSARDFGRDRALELVVASPAEETSRWRQEQYALQILEDVQNARIAEKTRMEMEIRLLKAQIASMERQVMNLDEVKSRSRRH